MLDASSAHIKAPGLQWSKGRPYWKAAGSYVRAGFSLRSVALKGTDQEIIDRCLELNAEAADWYAALSKPDFDAAARQRAKKLAVLKSQRGACYFDQIQLTAKKRAATKGRVYSLPDGWARDEFLRRGGKCALTGIAMHQDRRSKSPFMPTIDRINSAEGYTPENCRLICFICNMAKGVFTDTEFYLMCTKASEFKRDV